MVVYGICKRTRIFHALLSSQRGNNLPAQYRPPPGLTYDGPASQTALLDTTITHSRGRRWDEKLPRGGHHAQNMCCSHCLQYHRSLSYCCLPTR